MLVRMITITAMITAFASTAAFAQADNSASAPEATASAKPVKEKKTCRQQVDIGSIMPKRTCRTPEEWAAIDDANASEVSRYSNSRSQQAGGLGR